MATQLWKPRVLNDATLNQCAHKCWMHGEACSLTDCCILLQDVKSVLCSVHGVRQPRFAVIAQWIAKCKPTERLQVSIARTACVQVIILKLNDACGHVVMALWDWPGFTTDNGKRARIVSLLLPQMSCMLMLAVVHKPFTMFVAVLRIRIAYVTSSYSTVRMQFKMHVFPHTWPQNSHSQIPYWTSLVWNSLHTLHLSTGINPSAPS